MSRDSKRYVAPIVHRLSRPVAQAAARAKPLATPLSEVPSARAGIEEAKAERTAVVNDPEFWAKVWNE